MSISILLKVGRLGWYRSYFTPASLAECGRLLTLAIFPNKTDHALLLREYRNETYVNVDDSHGNSTGAWQLCVAVPALFLYREQDTNDMFTTRVLGACSKGNIPLLEELSREGNLKVCLDKFGASGIHYAVRAGKLECLIWLVGQRGLDPNKAANNGATPMHDAAATGQLECLKWLINTGGCYPNMRDFCEATPLHLAARFGHLSIVSWLVESEFCNPLDKAQNGTTSVHLAAAKGSLNCLKWIVERDRT